MGKIPHTSIFGIYTQIIPNQTSLREKNRLESRLIFTIEGFDGLGVLHVDGRGRRGRGPEHGQGLRHRFGPDLFQHVLVERHCDAKGRDGSATMRSMGCCFSNLRLEPDGSKCTKLENMQTQNRA